MLVISRPAPLGLRARDASSRPFGHRPARDSMSQLRKLFSFRSLDPSLFLTGICTAAFYTIMSLPSMKGSVLSHYTTEHVVEYVIVTLFIWGIIDIGLK